MQYNSKTQSSAAIDQNITLFRQLPWILLINVPLIVSFLWLYWQHVSHLWLILWCSMMTLIMVLRFIMVYIHRHIKARWGIEHWQMNIFAANSFVSGVMWGWAGVLFYVPDNLELQLYIFVLLVFKGAGSVTAVTSYLPAFYWYFPVSMAPITVLLLREGTPTHLLLGLASICYVAILIYFGRNFNRTLIESLNLRYENQQLLERANHEKEKAEQANRAKSKFLAAASHDLRQPLHALSLFNSVLEDSTLTEKQTSVVTNIRKSIHSLEYLLNALLDISRFESGSVSVNLQHFDLSNLLKKLDNDFSLEAQKKNLQLLWPSNQYYVHSDPALVEQLLRNLVANAIRYTHHGHVAVTVDTDEKTVIIHVQDTGIGIEPALQEKIFHEFYQIHNPQRDRQQGLGLGLALVKRIVDLLDCCLTLKSESGKGSIFSFSLEPGKTPHSPSKIPSSKNQLKTPPLNLKVAILEDDIEAAHAIELALSHWGCDVTIRSTLADLETLLNKAHYIPDVFISDLQLAEGESGEDAARAMQNKIGRHLSIILITGNINKAPNKTGDLSGLPLLYKPIAPAKLRTLLNRAQRLRNQGQHEEANVPLK